MPGMGMMQGGNQMGMMQQQQQGEMMGAEVEMMGAEGEMMADAGMEGGEFDAAALE